MGKCSSLSYPNFPSVLILTLAGLAITTKAEAKATAAGTSLVAVTQQTDVRATSSLPKLIQGTCMAAHCPRGGAHKQHQLRNGI